MADEITNIVILQHIHAMKSDLELQITALKSSLEERMTAIEQGTAILTGEMRKGFEEAREHRQALQEDLEATMKMLSKHEAKLARL